MNDFALDCYRIHDVAPEIIPARASRDWMDHFAARQPYRCLPLTMANAAGWEILCPFDLEVEWNGGPGAEDLVLRSNTAGAHIEGLAVSHFRAGILTFHTGYLFRTPPGISISCGGPPNQPKDGIYALSGLVETDWLPFPFTMNWQMTRPGTVRFEKGEAFCWLTLTRHASLQEVQPTLKKLRDDAELTRDYHAWSNSRQSFIDKLASGDGDTVKAGWQKDYMRGQKPGGEAVETDHLTRLRLYPPR